MVGKRVSDARLPRENRSASLVVPLESHDVNIRVFLAGACSLAEEWEAEKN